MVVIRIVSWIMLFLGLYYIGVAVAFCFPQSRAVTLGKLERTKHKKNVHVRKSPHGKFIVAPHQTEFVYSYTAGARTYTVFGSALKSPNQLPYRPQIVYMKRIPRYAFVSELTIFQRPWWGIFLVFVSLILLIVT